MPTAKTVFHQTAVQRFLEVRYDDLQSLGLLSAISAESYLKGKAVLLDDAQDAQIFTQAIAAHGWEVSARSASTPDDMLLARATPYNPAWRPYTEVQDRDRVHFITPIHLQSGVNLQDAVIELQAPGYGKKRVSEVYLRMDNGRVLSMTLSDLKQRPFELRWRRDEGLKVFKPEVRQDAGHTALIVIRVGNDGRRTESDDLTVHDAHVCARSLGSAAMRFRHDGDIEVYPLNVPPSIRQLQHWVGEPWESVSVQTTPTRFGWGDKNEAPYIAFADENGLAVDRPVLNRMFARIAAPDENSRSEYSCAGNVVLLVGVRFNDAGELSLAPVPPDAPAPPMVHTRV